MESQKSKGQEMVHRVCISLTQDAHHGAKLQKKCLLNGEQSQIKQSALCAIMDLGVLCYVLQLKC